MSEKEKPIPFLNSSEPLLPELILVLKISLTPPQETNTTGVLVRYQLPFNLKSSGGRRRRCFDLKSACLEMQCVFTTASGRLVNANDYHLL